MNRVVVIIICLLSLVGEATGKFPNILVFPSNHSSQIGGNVTFACNVGLAVHPSTHAFLRPIMWLGPDLEVIRSTSGRIRVERINGNSILLHVTNIRWSDQGRYRCIKRSRKVRRSFGGHYDDYGKAESLLSVQDSIGASYQSIRVPLGDDVILPCSGSENMRVVEWYFKSKKIVPDESHSITSEGLQIKAASLDDDGFYECKDGWTDNRLRLQVLLPPIIERLMIPTKVIRGQDINITCEVRGKDRVQFQWAKEQKVSDMVRVKKKLQVKSKQLELFDVTSDDEGRYFCLVAGDGGSDEKSVDLKVLSPPTITSVMEDRLTVLANSSLVLVCVADGVPSPKIEWMMSTQDGRTLQTYEEFRESGIEVMKGMLRINSTDKLMTGNVTCLASNEAGSSSRTSTIIVEHEPSSSLSPPLQYGWMDEKRKFKCTSLSFPLATLSWFHNDLYLEASHHHHHDHHHHYHHHQVIDHVSQNTIESIMTISIPGKSTFAYGNYTCLAKNKHGHTTNTAFLVQGFVPDPPRNISILDENPHEIVITGDSQDNPLQPISWSVSYEEHKQGSKQHREIFSYGERIILRNLKPATEYTVYLALRNAVGYGQPTKFKLHTPSKNSSSKNTFKQSMFSNEKMHVSDASISNLDSKNQDYESKFSSMKKTKKKSNLETSNHIIWAMATGLILTVASSITTACFCTAWRQRHRKCQNTSDILSLRGQINSPIPPNSILLVPVSSNDQNGQPVLTNDDVETLASELASLSQDTPNKTLTSDQPFGTFPRHFKQSKEDNLNCFSPVFSPATSSNRKVREASDIFGAQFRKIQPESNGSPTCNGHSFTSMKKNFMPIMLDRTSEDIKHSKRFIPIAESTLRKNYTNESFSTCGGYKSADNVDDDIDSVGCNTPSHQQFISNRTYHNGTFAYVRSMSQLK